MKKTISAKLLQHLIIIAIISAAGIFHLSTIRTGHNWGDDFSMYIMHAINIVDGRGYGDTGYLFNPMHPSLGPATYPPIFPLMLAPVYKLWGLNLAAMQTEIIVIFIFFLFAFYITFKNEMTFPFLAVMIAAIGFNPFFWDFKDNILSEFPFIFWTYLGFFLIRQTYAADGMARSKWLYAALAGITIYLAYGTRSIGFVLIPSLLVYDVLKHRRPTTLAACIALISLSLIGLQVILTHSDASYLKLIEPNTKVTALKLFKYVKQLSTVWDNGYAKPLRSVMSTILLAFAVYGIYDRIKRAVSIFEIFLLFYAIFLVSYCLTSKTLPNPRHILPIMPLYVFYAVYGIHRFTCRKKRRELAAAAVLGVVIFATYAAKYSKTDFGPLDDGVEKKETIEVFDYIKSHTDERAVFIFCKPRALALFTGRRASVHHEPADDTKLWKYFNEIQATHIVLTALDIDTDYLRGFVSKYSDDLDEIYSNSDFKVYKIKQPLRHGRTT